MQDIKSHCENIKGHFITSRNSDYLSLRFSVRLREKVNVYMILFRKVLTDGGESQ